LQSHFDVIVIGNGLAGLAAARNAARAGLSTASVEPQLFGGLVAGINHLDGLLAGENCSGISLAGSMMAENASLGVEQICATVTSMRRSDRTVVVATDGESVHAKAVVIASGAKRKRLNVPGEAELMHRGVSDCADCDGPIFAGQQVIAVGGGDSALQEAAALAGYCSCVHLVHRRSDFRAKPHLIRETLGKNNVEVRYSSEVEEILGSGSVSGVRLRDLATGQRSEVPCAAVFSYIGLVPNSDFAPAGIERDTGGAILTDTSMRTGMPGVFAIGAVRAGYRGQIVDAWMEAETAITAIRSMPRDGFI
jgi:thioredoxin reductase (NADPH)